MTTYSEFQNKSSSSKVGLCRLDASKRLMGWVLHSGSIYSVSFNEKIINSIEDSGVALVSVSDVSSVTAGKYYHDRDNGIIYLRTSDSVNPNGKFIACEFRMFFATQPVAASYDLSSGVSVYWEPSLLPLSEFGVDLDNTNQLGFAIEGSGSVKMINDRDFWDDRFDKYTFENKSCYIYSWSNSIPITEAKLIYRGKVTGKSWSAKDVSFTLKDTINELRQPLSLTKISAITSDRVPSSLKDALQRRVYGRVSGLRPLNIDQLTNNQVQGYPLTGTLTLTNGSDSVTGVGTSFLAHFSPNDQIIITVDDEDENATVLSVQSNTALTLTSDWDGSNFSGSFRIKPDRSKRYTNRVFKVAGHETREPNVTVINSKSARLFEISDATDIREGDTVEVNGELATVDMVAGNFIRLVGSLVASPDNGDSFIRPSVSNVRINDTRLIISTSSIDSDFEYDATTGVLELTQLAEFNRAPDRSVNGTSITITSASRSVTGVGTNFLTQILPSDWIRISGESEFFEVLQVISDTSLELRTAATYTGTAAGVYRSPDYYTEGEDVLTLDILGTTDDDTSDGYLLETGPAIVKDLLLKAGISASDIDSSEFDDASDIAYQSVGFVIPEKYNDKKSPRIRDLINQVSISVFGSLIQSNDFKFTYKVLSPDRPSTSLLFEKEDILNFSIKSVSDKIAKTISLTYSPKEYDFTQEGEFSPLVEYTSSNAQYLSKTANVFTVETILSDLRDAEIMAARWAFLKEVASSTLTFTTKMRGATLEVGDKVEISHPKLFNRLGSNDKRKVAAVQSAKKSSSGSSVEIEDLSNAFSRCAVIMEGTANDYDDATASELSKGGWITDQYGMIDNDASTFGTNLIF